MMSNEVATTELPEMQPNVINYEPIFPILTAGVLLDLPIEEMVNGILKKAVDIKNHTSGYTTYFNRENIDNIEGVSLLKEAIYGISCSFGRELKYELDYERCALHLWANVMRKGDYHEMHNHPRSIFSGTFYARIDDTMSPLVIKNPSISNRMHEPVVVRPEDNTPFNASLIVIKPKVNNLHIWPSWLEHKVPEMEVGGPRVSFSFSVDFLQPGA